MAVEVDKEAKCGGCGATLDEQYNLPLEARTPCPKCGSLIRALRISISETVEVHDSLRLAHKDSDGKKLAQIQSGDDLHRDTNTWRVLERVIDWSKKWYTETIKDRTTGEVISHTSEDLRAHTGHGAAKPKDTRDS